MTWLGKILTFLVFIFALVWAWFTVTAYVTRTNWKNQADMYKAAYQEAVKARQSEYDRFLASEDQYRRQIAAEQEKSKGLVEQLAVMDTANKKALDGLANANAIIKSGDINAVQLAASYQAAIDELNKVRARSDTLENTVKDLTLARANAERDRQGAENLAKQAQAEKLLADQRIEGLLARVVELEATGGGTRTAVLATPGGAPAPVPEGLRGTVTGYGDGLVVLSVGLDAGLTPGAVLDIYREDGGGRYLGTVKVDRLYPKQAVGVFIPSDPKRTVKQLRPEELPKVGDLVGRIRTTSLRQ